MNIGTIFSVGDIIIKDTKRDAPQRQPDKQDLHHCVVVSDKFVFILGKDSEYYKAYEPYLIVLRKHDNPWLDQDRYIDCCKLSDYTTFEVAREIGVSLAPEDIKRLYLSLEKIMDLSPEQLVEYRIEMPKQHVRVILEEINDWSLDKYSKPITDI